MRKGVLLMHSYDELIKLITMKRDTIILNSKELADSRIRFLRDFFNQYSPKRISSFFSLKPSELLLTILLYEEKNTSFLELEEKVKLVEELLDMLDGNKMMAIQSVASDLEIEECNKLLEDVYHTETFTENIKMQKKIVELFKKKKNKGILVFLLTCMKSDLFSNILELVALFKRIENKEYQAMFIFICQLHQEITFAKDKLSSSMNEDMAEKIVKEVMSHRINQKEFDNSFNPLYQYYLSLEKIQSTIQRENNKKLYSYTELLSILEQEHKKEEIQNINSILEKAIETDIQTACLKYIYSHNEKYYQKLEEEYAYKNENSISKFIDCFNRIGISFTEFSEETRREIMQKSLEEIQKMIKLLLKLSFPNSKVVLICAKSNFLVVQKLNDLLTKRYIDLEFLQGNIALYYDEKELENLDKNIEASLKEKINLSKIADKSFLTTPNILVMENIKLLKVRGINLAQFTELKVLKEDNLEERINTFIEVGLEKAILKDPNILNRDANLAKRVLIARMIGQEIMENNTLLPLVVDKNLFFVPDSKIDKYLIDRENSNYHSDYEIEFSEEEKGNLKLSYDVEGIKIPKARVTNLSISLETIIRPSLYNKEEIKILERRAK